MSTPASAPAVFLGMHRSGTTLAAELARALGLELGRVTSLMELQPLVDLNEWLLRRSGGSWEYPRGVLDMLAVPELREQAQAEVDEFSERHLRRFATGGEPWGWKDPRMTFMLPLWERSFPTMRLVAVRRHGFDTALSLSARAQRETEAGRGPLAHHRLRLRLRNLVPGRERRPTVSARCHTPEGALATWAEYNRRLDHVIATTTHPLHELRLEDVLNDPRAELHRLCGFLGLGNDDARVDRALAAVELREASRAAQHPRVAAVASEGDLELLRHYGYAEASVR